MSSTGQVLQFRSHCSVAGCCGDVLAKGLCVRHYGRARAGRPLNDPPEKHLDLTDVEAAWLAAVLDCEGWIGLNKSSRGSGGAYCAKVGVGNTNQKLTDRLLELTGCGYVRHVDPKSPRAKEQWHWNVHRRNEVRAILRAVLPHLLLKREQAELLLSMPGLHDKANSERELLHLKLRALNRKGRPIA